MSLMMRAITPSTSLWLSSCVRWYPSKIVVDVSYVEVWDVFDDMRNYYLLGTDAVALGYCV
jgi:hypothetical protein